MTTRGIWHGSQRVFLRARVLIASRDPPIANSHQRAVSRTPDDVTLARTRAALHPEPCRAGRSTPVVFVSRERTFPDKAGRAPRALPLGDTHAGLEPRRVSASLGSLTSHIRPHNPSFLGSSPGRATHKSPGKLFFTSGGGHHHRIQPDSVKSTESTNSSRSSGPRCTGVT